MGFESHVYQVLDAAERIYNPDGENWPLWERYDFHFDNGQMIFNGWVPDWRVEKIAQYLTSHPDFYVVFVPTKDEEGRNIIFTADPCSMCGGRGTVQDIMGDDLCPECDGNGWL